MDFYETKRGAKAALMAMIHYYEIVDQIPRYEDPSLFGSVAISSSSEDYYVSIFKVYCSMMGHLFRSMYLSGQPHRTIELHLIVRLTCILH
jgi:hypothetical protein